MKRFTIILIILLTIFLLGTTVYAEDAPACDGLLKALDKIPPDSPGYAKVLEKAKTDCAAALEHAALIALYNSTTGDNWNDNTNWLDETISHCDWYGVTCDESGYVDWIVFPINNLTGAIPPELGNLGNLDYLYLVGNQLTGAIPPELGNLGNLQTLSLANNQLTGAILPELGNLGNLWALSLANNQLTGCIPVELSNMSSLNSLSLHSNELSGWETQAALDWALSLPTYYGPNVVAEFCP